MNGIEHPPVAASLTFKEKVGNFFNKPTVKKVIHVAYVILAVAITAFCFWANPMITAGCFIAGVALAKPVAKMADRIKTFLVHSPWYFKLPLVVGAYFALPVFWITATTLWPMYMGSEGFRFTKDRYEQHAGLQNPQPQPA